MISEDHCWVVVSWLIRDMTTAFWSVFGESMPLKLYWFDVTKSTGGLLLARIAASWNCGKLVLAELRMRDKVGFSPSNVRNESL